MGLQADYDLEEARNAAQNELKKVENIAAYQYTKSYRKSGV